MRHPRCYSNANKVSFNCAPPHPPPPDSDPCPTATSPGGAFFCHLVEGLATAGHFPLKWSGHWIETWSPKCTRPIAAHRSVIPPPGSDGCWARGHVPAHRRGPWGDRGAARPRPPGRCCALRSPLTPLSHSPTSPEKLDQALCRIVCVCGPRN